MRATLFNSPYPTSIIAAILLLTHAGCIFQGCTEEMKSEARSPDGAVMATLFERDCGATTPFISHVNLRSSNGQFKGDEDGVIKEGQVLVIKGPASWIKLTWEGSKNLVIECLGCATNPHVSKEDRWQDISIALKNVGTSDAGH